MVVVDSAPSESVPSRKGEEQVVDGLVELLGSRAPPGTTATSQEAAEIALGGSG